MSEHEPNTAHGGDDGGADETPVVQRVAPQSVAEIVRSLTRITTELSGNVTQSGRHALEDALQGKPPSQVVSSTLAELVVSTREALEAELKRMEGQAASQTPPASDRTPATVRGVAKAVADSLPSPPATSAPESHDNDLRRQAETLLRRSRSLDDLDEHPAMSRVLREISPDEARIIRYLGETGPQAVIDVVAHNPWTRKFRELAHNASIVGREAGCAQAEDTPIYLDNLSRLGVVVIRGYRMRSQPNYDFILAQPEVMYVTKPVGRLVRLKHIYKGVELSLFGRELFRAAFETETSQLAPVPDVL